MNTQTSQISLEAAWHALRPRQNWWNRIPGAVLAAMERHALYGQIAGHFVTGCLVNDLSEAVGRADIESLRALGDIVTWLVSNMPANAWGSIEKTHQWRREGGFVGRGLVKAALDAGATPAQVDMARAGCPVCHRPVFITGEQLVSDGCQHPEAVELVCELRNAVGTWPQKKETSC